MTLDNPAGRLLSLFEAFRHAFDTDGAVLSAWDLALSASTEVDRVVGLCRAAWLLDELESTVARVRRPVPSQLHAKHRGAWREAVLTSIQVGSVGYGFTSKARPLLFTPSDLSEDQMQGLAVLDELFADRASDGNVPEEAELTEYRAELSDLIQAIGADDNLPSELRSVMTQRLHDLGWALDHVRLGGPDSVRAAIERLVGQIALSAVEDSSLTESAAVARVTMFGRRLYFLFLTGAAAPTAIEGWRYVFRELGVGE